MAQVRIEKAQEMAQLPRTEPVSSPPAHASRRFSRRGLFAGVGGSACLAVAGAAGYAWRIEPLWVEVVRRDMPIPGLDKAFNGTTLIQLSDLHVGSTMPISHFEKWLAWVNDQSPDLVVLTGDTVHYGNRSAALAAAGLVTSLRAKEGVFASFGNHEWGATCMGGGRSDVAAQVTNIFTACGIKLLLNQSVVIKKNAASLYVVGVEDYWSTQFDPDAAFAGLPADAPVIVLSHNPDTFLEMLDRPFAWMLAGHTHGGQVNLPLVGPPMLPLNHKEFVAGHYTMGGKNLYVNRGLGWLMRLRFNARPEITVFTLRCA